jgi:uncharacterized protein (TIGR03435 family)
MSHPYLYGLAFLAACLIHLPVRAQSPAPRPEFAVASIRWNRNCGTRRGGDGPPNPGRIALYCWATRDIIESAYVRWASGPNPRPNRMIIGGPSWADSDLYDIEARADGDAPPDQMYGPMMQRLLENRFQLKIHSETREVPVYALKVAKRGLKVKPSAQGSCEILDVNTVRLQIAAGDSRRPICGPHSRSADGNVILDALGTSMAEFSEGALSNRLDRPVVDRTGVAGRFDFHLEFSPDQLASPAGDSVAPSIFSAVQDQLGLRLEPARGTVPVLVIDRLERPSSN